MEDSWEAFDRWLGSHWPEGLRRLGPPASDEALSTLEGVLGCALPDDLVRCLRIHDGQRPGTGGLFDGTEFLSARRIADEWSVWKGLLDGGDFEDTTSEPRSGVKSDWWNAKWIPVTYDGAGNHLCLDLDPDVGGTVGQVITMWHDDPSRELLADGLGTWFQRYVSGVIDGEYVHAEEYDGIVHRNDVS